jgi:NitT/TauT family transport system ATP-binding protein
VSTTTVKDVTVSFSAKPVFRNLTLSIDAGSCTALVGENGSGKTTLLRILLGLETLASGSAVTFASADVRTSYIPQDYRNAVLPWLNLSKNLNLALSPNDGASARSDMQFVETARQFKIEFDLKKYPNQLSGGEQQVFLIARALLARPSFLVLDEPFSAIDYGRRQLVRNFMAESIENQRITVVFSSHDFEDAVLMADQVVVLSKRSLGIQGIYDVPLPWPRHSSLRNNDSYRDILSTITAAVLKS